MPSQRALPEWAKDLESCWAEWTGGHITTSTFATCVSEIVTKHIIPAGYSTPDSIPVADILREIEHIKANAKSLASFAGQKEEARCRELCAPLAIELLQDLFGETDECQTPPLTDTPDKGERA